MVLASSRLCCACNFPHRDGMRRLSIVPSQRIAVRAGDVGRLTEHLRSEQGRVLSSVVMRGAFDTTPRTRRDWGVHSRYDHSLIVATRSSLVPPCDFGRLTKTAVSGPSRMW